MGFTDLVFLYGFLPLLLGIYYIVPAKCRDAVLIAFSFFFYACGSPAYVLLLLGISLIDIGLGNLIIYWKRKGAEVLPKLVLDAGILLNIGLLGYYKYYDLFSSVFSALHATRELLIPLGLSFFVFKAISYLADAYSGKIEKNEFVHPLTYLSFFGQIQSGPIARYNSFNRDTSNGLFYRGTVRFMIGFSEKVLLADVLNNITVEVFEKTSEISTPLIWLASICYSLQLYFDFAGYSNMAIGICNMLGFDCLENFDYPYASKSISEFWRRWHISLGTWFRDYVYIPMGGSRVGKIKLYCNLFTVWLLTGLWHGAGWNYIVWGLGFFVIISIEKTLDFPNRFQKRVSRTAYRIFTLLFINCQWVLFRSADLQQGMSFLAAMFGKAEKGGLPRAVFLLKDYGWFIFAAILCACPLGRAIEVRCSTNQKRKTGYEIVYAGAVTVLFFAALSFVISGQNNPFLYADF